MGRATQRASPNGEDQPNSTEGPPHAGAGPGDRGSAADEGLVMVEHQAGPADHGLVVIEIAADERADHRLVVVHADSDHRLAHDRLVVIEDANSGTDGMQDLVIQDVSLVR